METIGLPELLVILVIVILVFGVGRIGKIAGEVGTGIRSFKKGLEGDDVESSKTESAEKPASVEEVPADHK